MRLDGKVALITGAAGGIGKAVAEAYAESGADCILCELPEKMSDLDPVCEAVSGCGRKVMPLPLQVRDMASINNLVDAAIGGMGRIDILVNSAGVNRAIDAFDVTEEDWDFILDINLKGLFFLSQRAGREMKESGGGKIINMASIMGMVGYYQRAPYCSSKAGIVNLTKVLAIEWAPHKINVNAIGPTFLVTPLTQAYFDDPEKREEMARRQPIQRPGQPEDVTGAAVFLASDAADLITGHTMMVDGGWTAW
jgi:2-deoxy-D-gluconate 3-dehydrogenase